MSSELPESKILFIHPDLGIGGAERLVIDYAMGLQECGHQIEIATSHLDNDHCFEEVKLLNDKRKLKVNVYGDFLPTSLGNRFMIIFSILRQLWLILYLFWTKEIYQYDFIIVDQLSVGLPFLQAFTKAKVVFYCHFPDLLLSNKGNSWIKNLYRLPIDLLEQFTTSSSDKILVNSHFTKGVFYDTFKLMRDRNDVEVSYPCVDTNNLEIDEKTHELFNNHLSSSDSDCEYLVSVNRFEKKKNLELAIKSFNMTLDCLSAARKDKLKLYVCGGYDDRVTENKEYLKQLIELCTEMKLRYLVLDGKNLDVKKLTPEDIKNKYDVIFIKSIPTLLKNLIVSKSSLLLYTPSNEHFGIVPVESMLLGTPVLAPNNGGPLETILQNETGWLIEPKAEEWCRSILNCILTIDKLQVASKCKTYAAETFSRNKIVSKNLNDRILKKLSETKKTKAEIMTLISSSLVNLVFFLLTQALITRIPDMNHDYTYGCMVFLNVVLLKNYRFAGYWAVLGAMTMSKKNI
ncbi:hypothetical protein QEN19_000361 [Hanseniaspora menglaensis]